MMEARISSGGLAWRQPGPRHKHLWLALVVAIGFGLSSSALAQTQPSPQQTAATIDRMIAAHKSQQELAQYVFDTHGCKSCHTMGQNGKLGFTPRGQQNWAGF
jgi:hypothetical protein